MHNPSEDTVLRWSPVAQTLLSVPHAAMRESVRQARFLEAVEGPWRRKLQVSDTKAPTSDSLLLLVHTQVRVNRDTDKSVCATEDFCAPIEFLLVGESGAGSQLKFASAIRAEGDLNRVICDGNFPVSPIFKNEAGASLIYHPKKSQSLFLVGLRN